LVTLSFWHVCPVRLARVTSYSLQQILGFSREQAIDLFRDDWTFDGTLEDVRARLSDLQNHQLILLIAWFTRRGHRLPLSFLSALFRSSDPYPRSLGCRMLMPGLPGMNDDLMYAIYNAAKDYPDEASGVVLQLLILLRRAIDPTWCQFGPDGSYETPK
jgi:hypothetical protein